MTVLKVCCVDFMSVLRLIRYRFFLFAGIIPYLLGQAIVFGMHKPFNQGLFWWGFAGLFLVLIAVELFNEYFDDQDGGDRIFSNNSPEIPKYYFSLGITALFLAGIIALYLTWRAGWSIMLFSFFGALGAYFYVGPPFKWAYRGLGELVIALCYGPFMVLGSYYLQTKTIHLVPLYASLISGLSVFCLAILNEIPDYYQDRLVGKLNITVRLGKQRALSLLILSLGVVFVLLVAGVALKIIPALAIAPLITLPWLFRAIKPIIKDFDNPIPFRCAVNTIVINHIVITLLLGLSFLCK